MAPQTLAWYEQGTLENIGSMSGELAIILWLVLVIASAVVVSFLAHRWGRDPFGWVLLSAAMGPIAIVALLGTRRADRARKLPQAQGARTGGGPIIVACDGSKAGAKLAEHVAGSDLHGREVVLVTVLPFESEPQDAGADVRKSADDMTRVVSTALEVRGISSRVAVRYGPPGEAIVSFANEVNASLIVIGRRGSGVTRAVLGSVSRHVVEQAEVPVALVS